MVLSYAIGDNIFCIFKKFVFKFSKNRTVKETVREIMKQLFFNVALLILIVFSFTLGVEYFNLSELRN